MTQSRFKQCVRYNLRGMIRPTAVFVLFFALIDLGVPTLLYSILGDSIRSGQSTFTYGFLTGGPGSLPFLLGAMIFLFVGAYASFRETFNHLLLLNNSRIKQFWATMTSMLIASCCLVVIGVIIGWAETTIQAWIGQRDPLVALGNIFTGYGQNPAGLLFGLLVCLAVLLSSFAFGEVAGALSYRFGNLFVLPFWICLGSSFMVVPIIMGTNLGFRQAILWFIGYQQDNQTMIIALHLLAFMLAFKVISFLTLRKLQQST